MRGIDGGSERRTGDGGRDVASEEKGKGHVIICRSSTSLVNPRSCLTWLIKGAIKGPPPEILRRKEKDEENRPERERKTNGRMREKTVRRG